MSLDSKHMFLPCHSFPAPVLLQARSSKYVRTFRSHSNTSSIFYPHQNTSKPHRVRCTCSVGPQLSSSGFIVASTIILLFSDITIVYPYQNTSKPSVLTETRPLYSIIPYQTTSKAFVLTQIRSHTLIATHPTSAAPATSAVAC